MGVGLRGARYLTSHPRPPQETEGQVTEVLAMGAFDKALAKIADEKAAAKRAFFDDMKARAADIGEPWEERAERRWAAREKAAAWLDDQPLPEGCALYWPSGTEPECFRTWDLYSLDDYDHVTAFPPGMYVPMWADEGGAYGCCSVETVVLPNGWSIVVGYHS